MSSSMTADSATKNATGGAVGVQELIDRLKAEGVQEGQQQADALLAEAKKQAQSVIDKADADADKILLEAQQESDQIKNNGKLALTLASRDASLHLKELLEHEFRGWIGSLVHKQLDAPEFLADLIREMATRTIASLDGQGSDETVGQDSKAGEKLHILMNDEQAGSLDAFVHSQADQMLREGVELRASRSVGHGFRVRLAEQNIDIDFTDEAVTAALMRFLAPKFRKIIEISSNESVGK